MTTNIATKANEKKAQMRDKRAQSIAAMGLVKREGDRFKVATPTLRGRQSAYEVWRDAQGKIRCSCLEFTEFATEDTAFRCEHILAVKHALLAKGTEAQPVQPANAPVPASAGDSPALNTNATEELVKTATSEREPDAPESEISNVRSLAEHLNVKEHKEMKLQDPFALEQEESEIMGETPNNVIPLNFVSTLRHLRQQVDSSVVKTREGWTDRNGQQRYVEYVEWHTVADILDRVAPTWSHSVRNINLIGDIVAVTAAITIDGVTREGIGTGYADSEMGIKKAEHDALKRAAVKFGIARELYQKEAETIEREGGAPTNRPFSGSPQARSLNDLVTAKQLGMIRALAREAGVEADEESQSVFKCKTDELSKRAASGFIDHLKALAQETVAGELRRAS
jgi:hypothetical protein